MRCIGFPRFVRPRPVMAPGLALALAGCVGSPPGPAALAVSAPARAVADTAVAGPAADEGIKRPATPDARFAALYQPISTDRFEVPGVPASVVRKGFERREVAYASKEPPGTIVVDAKAHYLYLVEADGRAMRYGVGVGKQGFSWSGEAVIKTKQEWPDWYPPKEMVERHPELKPQLDKLQSGMGVAGGYRNPLGARAMYLWQGNKDTYFRIHGTLEPHSIGTNASSGCIRMINQDAIDLYGRVREGTRVVVL